MTHEELYRRACNVIPGGVNSPVRAFNGVGGTPLYVESGSGSKVRTADGRELTDFCCSWGAMILGHAHVEVVAAINEQAAKGTTFGINTPIEVLLAERLCALIPGLERVRLVNSGTEAVMTALRIARGVTGRKRIIKFDGCYHGHSDSVLVAAGSGLLTGGTATSLGVCQHTANDTYVLPYNDISAVRQLVHEKGREIAAIIVEPIAGNMGLVLPEPEFLRELCHAASQCGALTIFDEVICGFRFALSSYAATIGLRPDLLTLGKVIGGGLPLAAVGGSAIFLDQLAPCGKIYQAGTLSGNPLAVAAGLKTLEVLERDNPYPRMTQLAAHMADTINQGAQAKGLPLHCAQYGGVFTLFCSTAKPHRNLQEVKRCNTTLYARLFHALLQRGFYVAPSQFEIGFVSAAHSAEEIDNFAQVVVDAADKARQEV